MSNYIKWIVLRLNCAFDDLKTADKIRLGVAVLGIEILLMVANLQTAQELLKPRIFIYTAEASTNGELVSSQVGEKAGSQVSTIIRDGIEPTSKVKAQVSNLGEDNIISMITETFPNDSNDMVAIARAESTLNPKAEHLNNNGTKDCGLMQINSTWGYDCEWLKNPVNNLKAAKVVYNKQGKMAWMTYVYAVQHNLPI